MDNNENKKTPEEPADEALVDEALVDEALADDALDAVAGGKSVIIQNSRGEGKNLGGIV